MMLISCNHSYLWIQTMYSTLMNTKWKCQMPNNLQLQKLRILQSGHNNSCTTFPCCIVKEGNAIQPTYNNKWTIRGFCLFMFGTFLLSNPTLPTYIPMLYEPILQRKPISGETYNHRSQPLIFGEEPSEGTWHFSKSTVRVETTDLYQVPYLHDKVRQEESYSDIPSITSYPPLPLSAL